MSETIQKETVELKPTLSKESEAAVRARPVETVTVLRDAMDRMTRVEAEKLEANPIFQQANARQKPDDGQEKEDTRTPDHTLGV